MPSLPTLFFMAIFFLESLAAMLQNGFMAAVLGWEWARGRVLPMGDMIVACLAASRFGLHCMTFTKNLLIIVNFSYNAHYFGILWDFSNTLNFWLNALLSAFYSVRIASFSHPTFLWLRWRLSRSVPRLLLGSLAISILTNIPSVIGHTITSHMEASQPPNTNGTWTEWERIFYRNFFLLHEILVLLVPFLLFLVSTSLLMFSLHRHLRQMRCSQPGPRDPSTRAHTMVLKSLGFFLIFYSSYFPSLMVALTNIMTLQLHWYWAWQVVTYTGIFLHSTILLLSSPRLRRALKNRLQGCEATRCEGLNRGQIRGQVPPKGSEEPVQQG
ncbi:taste receptor type 2 member 143-like [Elephas maximus indicus]|uniref:taste receptor type 2 member 143-like n=1 Tax=Elephas maximus indicus TaxID=99487 RepID=UPI002117244B|nr:taste receptor type 2 member 143-like [Elephas maximus indicus]